ncbi:unnamed protein product, partial [Sphacelaria rigidula]
TNNSKGGALFIAAGAAVTLAGATTFMNNSAAYGGAISVGDDSVVSWGDSNNDEITILTFANNSASLYGGAVYISDNSTASWTGATAFIGNYADDEGGAVCLTGRSSLYSSPSITAAGGGGTGQDGLTSFVSNSAFERGGALVAWYNSTVSFGGENTTFVDNIAKYGAAIYSKSGSNISFLGGGDILIERGTLLCLGPTRFIGNSATDGQGGAVYVYEGSEVSWSGSDTLFVENTADVGGAVYITDSVNVSWGEGGGVTTFELNRAKSNGGAIGCSVGDSQKSTSVINIDGETNFIGNSCGSYGGALVLTSAVRMNLGPGSREVFSGNSAGAGGGAVFLSAA